MRKRGCWNGGEETPPESVDAERVRKSGTRRKMEKKQNVQQKKGKAVNAADDGGHASGAYLSSPGQIDKKMYRVSRVFFLSFVVMEESSVP